MLLTKTTAEILKKYQRAPGDTGSSEVQVALLSARISKLLTYLKRVDPQRYTKLIEELGLRG